MGDGWFWVRIPLLPPDGWCYVARRGVVQEVLRCRGVGGIGRSGVGSGPRGRWLEITPAEEKGSGTRGRWIGRMPTGLDARARPLFLGPGGSGCPDVFGVGPRSGRGGVPPEDRGDEGFSSLAGVGCGEGVRVERGAGDRGRWLEITPAEEKGSGTRGRWIGRMPTGLDARARPLFLGPGGSGCHDVFGVGPRSGRGGVPPEDRGDEGFSSLAGVGCGEGVRVERGAGDRGRWLEITPAEEKGSGTRGRWIG